MKLTQLQTITMCRDCQDYTALLATPPNGWGAHVHPIHGQSHVMLQTLYIDYGKTNVDTWLDNYYRSK